MQEKVIAKLEDVIKTKLKNEPNAIDKNAQEDRAAALKTLEDDNEMRSKISELETRLAERDELINAADNCKWWWWCAVYSFT